MEVLGQRAAMSAMKDATLEGVESSESSTPMRSKVLRLSYVFRQRYLASLPVLVPPVSQRLPMGIAKLCYRVSVVMVESDEGLYRDPSLPRAEHAASSLSRFGPSSPPQSPSVDFCFIEYMETLDRRSGTGADIARNNQEAKRLTKNNSCSRGSLR